MELQINMHKFWKSPNLETEIPWISNPCEPPEFHPAAPWRPRDNR